MALTFSDDLWDKFDIVFDRVTKGRHDLKKFSSYLKERAGIEDSYARSLKHAADKQNFETDSTLSKCWTDIRKSSSTLASQHVEFSKTCTTCMTAVDKHVEVLKKSKTKLSSAHNRCLKNHENKFKTHAKAKHDYTEGIRKSETAISNLLTARNNKKLKDKDIAKLEKQVRQSIKPIDELKDNYKKSVEALRKSQQQYAEQVAIMLKEFEEIEVKRLNVLKNEIVHYSQGHQWMKNSLEQIFSFTQTGLESIDIPKDIQDFIGWTRTNNDREPLVEYEEFPRQDLDNFLATFKGSWSPRTPRSIARVLSGPMSRNSHSKNSEEKLFSRKKLGIHSTKKSSRMSQKIDVSKSSLELEKQNEVIAKESKNVEVTGDENQNENVAEENISQEDFEIKACKALYDRDGAEDDELSFKIGEVLNITGTLDGWYLGYKDSDTEKVGIFPCNYVKVIE